MLTGRGADDKTKRKTARNDQGDTMFDVKTVLPNLRCSLGEGPHWDAKDGVLYWVDIVGKTAYALRPNDGGLSLIHI